ncbi:unnamed protein product [Lactuca virosa]|uniref:Transmembrane protein n=1 Tax=Lactuca virosa TaxID=75947 RepID=A0AAU9LZD2_9ASTR|nr:unnamed protein product [Lactuca virosa]
MVIINGRRSPICFTTTMLSLSIMMMMMMTTMVKECDGWMTPCNGSTTVECIHVVEFDEEVEFQMDTEVHRWILGEKNSGKNHISGKSLNKNKAAGGPGSKNYNAAGHQPVAAYVDSNWSSMSALMWTIEFTFAFTHHIW